MVQPLVSDLNTKLPTEMSGQTWKYVTLDPYYNPLFYNECLTCMENNGIPYQQFLYTRGSGSSHQYVLRLPRTPLMVNFDELTPDLHRYLINIVTPLDNQDKVIITRRVQDVGKSVRSVVYLNDALSNVSDFACFFHIPTRDFALQLSKDVPGNVWFFGKYMDNKINLGMVTSQYFLSFIPDDLVLLTLKPKEDLIKFEQRLNYHVFLNRDKLIKFARTPYFSDGVFTKPSRQTMRRFINV